jgi:hypothetical protein
MVVDIRKPLKKFLPHLLKAKEENLNEADTVYRIVKVLEDVLGYNHLTEITREMQIKDRFVDLTVKIDGAVKFLHPWSQPSFMCRPKFRFDYPGTAAAPTNKDLELPFLLAAT